MVPAAALAWLKTEGFSVKLVHDLAASHDFVRAIPNRAVLQDVGVAPDSTRAFMFVMTPEHGRFEEGYLGYVPPQNC